MKKFFYFTFIALICLFQSTYIYSSDKDSLKLYQLDSIVVTSTRAGLKSPIAHTNISKNDITKAASSHSLPMIIALQPSVVSTTEGGLGLGYSKFSVRGSDASRTNVTLNGVAINDGESQEVFWVNLPTLGGSLQSVQLQRGVGTSVNGSGAFGATFNMKTLSPSLQPYSNVEFSFGSYNTFMASVATGSGYIKGKRDNLFSFDTRYSSSKTKGYIRNAKAELNFFFLQGTWQNSSNMLKLIYILGDQSTGITWDGCPIDIYPTDRKYNSAGEYYDDLGNRKYYKNETDNYTQHHVQLHYIHEFNPFLNLSSTSHFTKGDGYYENYKYNQEFSKYNLQNQVVDGVEYKESDFIIRQLMDNKYFAQTLSLNYNKNNVRVNNGASYSYYDGDHFGRLLWSKYNQSIAPKYNWYDNNGKKGDFSIFSKAEVDFADNFTAYLDLQYRNIAYSLKGEDKDFVNLTNKLHYNFFNPKAGISYFLNQQNKFYFSVAVGHREPSRSDIKESIKAKKESDVKAERMIDYEFGYQFNNPTLSAGVNFYAMEYNNQLVATGRLTETGYVIQENIPDSYRRGVELMLSYRPISQIELSANATFSKNKLKNYTLYTDTYDNDTDWNSVAQTKTFLKSSNLTLSPEVVAMGALKYTPTKSWEFMINAKYVGKQYLDNSSLAISKVPAYFVMGANISKDVTIKNSSKLKFSLAVDNLLNRKYYSYGWIYRALFANGANDYIEKAVYSQAPIHFIARVAFEF